MANKRSALRRIRTNERDRLYNRGWKSRVKTALKRVSEAVESGNATLAEESLRLANSVIDKAQVKGVIHRNTANRRKSQVGKLLKGLADRPAV